MIKKSFQGSFLDSQAWSFWTLQTLELPLGRTKTDHILRATATLASESWPVVVVSERVHVWTLLLEEMNQRVVLCCCASFGLIEGLSTAVPIGVEFFTSRQTGLYLSVFHFFQLIVAIVSEIVFALRRYTVVTAIASSFRSIYRRDANRHVESIDCTDIIGILDWGVYCYAAAVHCKLSQTCIFSRKRIISN